MQTSNLPRTSGIYAIVNLANGRHYIGSAVHLKRRAIAHRRLLVAGTHPNRKLQASWNRHGADNFGFFVAEAVPALDDLIACEQRWIDETRACEVGFNLCPRAGSRRGCRLSPEALLRYRADRLRRLKPVQGFIDPEGRPFTLLNAKWFTQRTGVPQAAVSGLARGVLTSYKGWSHVNAKPKSRDWVKTYEGFIDPAGNAVGPVSNLQAFCAGRGLDPSAMSKLAAGKLTSSNGWTHVSRRPRRASRAYPGRDAVGFVSPSGDPVTIRNLARFCREHGLDWSTMCKVRAGRHRRHKGWSYPASWTPRGPKAGTVHVGFVAPDGNPTVITDMVNFCRANGLSTSAMSRLRLGRHRTYKGWTFGPPAVAVAT